MQPPEVGDAQRQLAVRVRRLPYSTQCEGQFIGLRPNSRSSTSLKNMLSCSGRSVPSVFHSSTSKSCGVMTSSVAVLAVEPAHEAHQLVVDNGALRVEERRRRRQRREEEEVELPAEPAVVAAPRFLEMGEVGVELLLRGEGGAVDTLQHLVALVALEVRARALEQLERADLVGTLHVRAAAQVDEVAVAEDRDPLALRDVGETHELDLLATRGEDRGGLVAAHLAALERAALLDDARHLGLDLLEVLGGETAREAEVVLELLRVILAAGVDDGAGEQVLDGVGEHVLGGVADHRPGLSVLRGQHPESARALDRRPQVDDVAVELAGDGGGGETLADGARHLERGGPRRVGALTAVRQPQHDLLVHRPRSPGDPQSPAAVPDHTGPKRKRPSRVSRGTAVPERRDGRRVRARTADLIRVRDALYRLSYAPSLHRRAEPDLSPERCSGGQAKW